MGIRLNYPTLSQLILNGTDDSLKKEFPAFFFSSLSSGRFFLRYFVDNNILLYNISKAGIEYGNE